MIGVELEEKFNDAIQQICQTDRAKKEAKEYFKNYLVNDMIDEALESYDLD